MSMNEEEKKRRNAIEAKWVRSIMSVENTIMWAQNMK
jgi:hypothetical protein